MPGLEFFQLTQKSIQNSKFNKRRFVIGNDSFIVLGDQSFCLCQRQSNAVREWGCKFLLRFLPDRLCSRSGCGVSLCHGLPRDPGLFDNADKLFPIAFQARAHGNILAGGDGGFKALALGEKLFQISAKGIFIDLRELDNGVKLAPVFLIEGKFFKAFAVQSNFSKKGIEPDHDRRWREAVRQHLEPADGVADGLAAVTTEWK